MRWLAASFSTDSSSTNSPKGGAWRAPGRARNFQKYSETTVSHGLRSTAKRK